MMTSTLGEMVATIAPSIPPSLMSSANIEAIATVAHHFPLTLGTTVGFECPLTAPEPAADFFLRVSGAWGRSLLAGQPVAPPILAQFQKANSLEPHAEPPGFNKLWSCPPWQNIRQIAQRWAEPTSLLHTAIDDLWLEFDIGSRSSLKPNQDSCADVLSRMGKTNVCPSASGLDGQRTSGRAHPTFGNGIPQPSTFLGVKSPGLPSLDWVGQIALPTLVGSVLSPQIQTTLQRCLAALPSSARLFQVGALSGRVSSPTDCPPLRLYIQNLTVSQLPSLLERLSWPGDRTLLTHMLARIGSQSETCSLQLELEEVKEPHVSTHPVSALSPKIAIECAFPDRTAWQKVLSRLVMLGFCRPDRAKALLEYPGYVRAQDSVNFPPLLKDWSAQLAPYRECLLVKRLAYLKFTYEPGHPLQAKAYLGLSPTWLDARYLQSNAANAAASDDQESMAIKVCKDLIQQLDYGEIDVDELFISQRSQKSRWLNHALETMCIGT
ncbi:MAG: hypothetical protein AAGD25_11090 [Cyanobacteria bacterium P01_F01_bin.150]